jgi:hypothetical protein
MRKIALTVIALAMVVAFVGCGESKETMKPAETKMATTPAKSM